MMRKTFAALAAAALMAIAPAAAFAAPGDNGRAAPVQGCESVRDNAGTGAENAAGTPSQENTGRVFVGLCS